MNRRSTTMLLFYRLNLLVFIFTTVIASIQIHSINAVRNPNGNNNGSTFINKKNGLVKAKAKARFLQSSSSTTTTTPSSSTISTSSYYGNLYLYTHDINYYKYHRNRRRLSEQGQQQQQQEQQEQQEQQQQQQQEQEQEQDNEEDHEERENEGEYGDNQDRNEENKDNEVDGDQHDKEKNEVDGGGGGGGGESEKDGDSDEEGIEEANYDGYDYDAQDENDSASNGYYGYPTDEATSATGPNYNNFIDWDRIITVVIEHQLLQIFAFLVVFGTLLRKVCYVPKRPRVTILDLKRHLVTDYEGDGGMIV